MNRVVIIGAGVMGTAIAMPLSDRGLAVDLVGTHLDRELVAAMQESRVHPRLKAEIGARVRAHQIDALAQVMESPPDLVIIGVSTPGAGWAAERLGETMRGTPPILMLTKGIAETPDRIEHLPARLARELAAQGIPHGPIGGIGGPCIAGELAVRRQTSAVVGFDDRSLAQEWADRISGPYYQLRATDDLCGLEICAALKNFYAIGVSVPHGRAARDPAPNGSGLHNEVASLFNQAVTELARIVEVSGGRAETALGLAGLGDLHVTTQAGRNSRLGKLIGEGMSCREAIAGPLRGETVEGTLVAASLGAPLRALAAAGVLPAARIPLANAIVAAVTEDRAIRPDVALYHL